MIFAGGGGFSGLEGRVEIVALDDGDQLAGLDGVAFFDRQRLDAAGNPGADQHFVGVDGADQLQIAGGSDGDEVPDQRAHGQQGQNHEDSISCVHRCLTLRVFWVLVRRGLWADAAIFGHRGRGQDAGGDASAVLAVSEDGAAQEFDSRSATRREGIAVQGVGSGDYAHEGSGEEVEDIGSKGGIANLQSIDGDQFARGNTFVNDFAGCGR